MNNHNIKNILPHLPDYYLFKSNTGLRLVLIPNKYATIISYGMYISVGSLNESDDELGIAHFLEHMMFKGSKKYPNKTLVNRLDNLGVDYNASTTFESTDYEIHGMIQHHNELLDILLDMYFNPQIPESTVDTERKIILEEYRMRYDDRYMKQYLNLIKLVTKKKYKLYSRPVIGTKESINKITFDDLNNFRKKYNNHNETIMTVSGNIDIEETKNEIENLIKLKINQQNFKFEPYKYEVIKNPSIKLSFRNNEINLKKKYIFEKVEGEQTNVSLNFPSWENFNNNNIYLNVLSSILTNGMSGRLTNILREDNGLTYNQSSSIDTFKQFGLFSISIGLDIKNLYKSLKLIFKELINIFKNGVLEEELTKIKNLALFGLMINFQKQLTYFNYFTEKIINNKKVYTLEEIIERYNKVTVDKMHQIIRTIINPKQLYISIVGSSKPNKRKIRKLMNYFNSEIELV